jgi:hypothetical protein
MHELSQCSLGERGGQVFLGRGGERREGGTEGEREKGERERERDRERSVTVH